MRKYRAERYPIHKYGNMTCYMEERYAEIFSEELNQKLIDNYIGDPDFRKLCSDEIDRIFYAGGTNEPPSVSNDNETDDSVKAIARLYQERKNEEKQSQDMERPAFYRKNPLEYASDIPDLTYISTLRLMNTEVNDLEFEHLVIGSGLLLNVNFTDTRFQRFHINRDIDFNIINCKFVNCIFTDCMFIGTEMQNCRFINCAFINSIIFNGFTKEKYCKFTNCRHIEVQI